MFSAVGETTQKLLDSPLLIPTNLLTTEKKSYVIALSGGKSSLARSFIHVLKNDIKEIDGQPVEIIYIVKSATLALPTSLRQERVAVVAPQWTHLESDQLECCDVIIHLAGEEEAENSNGMLDASFSKRSSSVTSDSWGALRADLGSWTEDKKFEALEQRIHDTEILIDVINQLKVPPKTFICVSESAYQGLITEVPDSLQCVEEDTLTNDYLLSSCCRGREKAVARIKNVPRIINLRLGLLLSGNSGVLQRLYDLFLEEKGGYLGTGEQWHSFVTVDDAARALLFLISHPSGQHLCGTIHLSLPTPIRDKEFMNFLQKLINNSSNELTALSASSTYQILGEHLLDTLVGSQFLAPTKLLNAGFQFQQRDPETLFLWCAAQFVSFTIANNLRYDEYNMTGNNSTPRRLSYTPTPAPSLRLSNSDDQAHGSLAALKALASTCSNHPPRPTFMGGVQHAYDDRLNSEEQQLPVDKTNSALSVDSTPSPPLPLTPFPSISSTEPSRRASTGGKQIGGMHF